MTNSHGVPRSVAQQARAGLAAPGRRTSRDVSVARRLASGGSIPLDLVRDLRDRHRALGEPERGNRHALTASLLWGGQAGAEWAESLVEREDARVESVLVAAGYSEQCAYRAIVDPDNVEPALIALTEQSGKRLRRWTGAGWEEVPEEMEPVGLQYVDVTRDRELLADLVTAFSAGQSGVLMHGAQPVTRIVASGEESNPDRIFALVDPLDPDAVIGLFQVSEDGTEVLRRTEGSWGPDGVLMSQIKGVSPPYVATIPAADVDRIVQAVDALDPESQKVNEEVVEAESAPDESVVASAVDNSDGVMVALHPPLETAAVLAVPDGEPVRILHVTLAYLGKQAEVPATVDDLVGLVADWAANYQPMTGEVSGGGHFDIPGGVASYASVDVPELSPARESLVLMLESNGVPVRKDHGFTPHITLAYDHLDLSAIPNLPLSFGHVSVVHGPTRVDIPFGPKRGLVAGAPSRMPSKLRSYWISGAGALKIRWGMPGDMTRCMRQMRRYMRPDMVGGACNNMHRARFGTWNKP